MCEACGYEDAIVDAEAIITTANQIDEENPSESAKTFANSVRGKALSMKEWMEEHEHTTESMVNALGNMLEGANRWVEDPKPASRKSKSVYHSDIPF